MQDVMKMAFLDELLKIAEEPDASKLKAGDILVSRLRTPSTFKSIAAKFIAGSQGKGTTHYHAAMYVGDGDVVDAHPGGGVTLTSLKAFGENNKFKALRVKTTPEVRDDAVDYAKKQVGKGYSFIGAAKTLLKGTPTPERIRQEAINNFICSQVVANAYHKVPFAEDRAIDRVRPIDFQNSPLTRVVSEHT